MVRRYVMCTGVLNAAVANNMRLREEIEVIKAKDKSEEMAQLLNDTRM